MIDFRYHLVSLVSVFLALAVGIVLGAGPLKGEIGNQLYTQVQNLRADAEKSRTEAKTAQAAADNRDTFIRDTLPTMVAEQLTGRSVALVSVPGADSDAIDPLTQALKASGATVTSQVTLSDAWLDPGKATDREAALRTLTPSAAALVGVPSGPATGAGSATPAAGTPSGSPGPATPGVAGANATIAGLGRLLARALLTPDQGQSGRPDTAAGALLQALAKDGLLSVDGEQRGRANEAVLLVPGLPPTTGNQASASTSPALDPTAQWSAVAVALDAAGIGAVVVGPASSATSGGVIAKIRGQDTVTKIVSTIDTGGTPMGDLTTVLALREQALGGTGSYGFVGKVDGPLPQRLGATP
jgi:hypothetical protein